MSARSAAKWVSVALVIVLALSAYVSGSAQAVGALPGPSPKAVFSTLRVGSLQEPDSLNPFVGVLGASYTVWAHVYELPIGIGTDLTPVPSIVQSWEVSSDGLVWTWHIVEGAVFHDGTPLTAEDVNFTMRYMWPQTPLNPIGCDLTLLQSYLGDPDRKVGIDVDNVTVIDDTTLRVPTWQPKANILSMFFFVIPKHIWSAVSCQRAPHVQNLPPIGTGMYKFTTWVRGTYLQLDLNDQYWRLDPAVDYVDRIVISYFTDATALFNAFRAGSIDATSALAAAQFTQVPDSVGGGTNNVGRYSVDSIGYSEMGACVASDNLIASFGKRGGRHWLVTNLTVRQAVQIATNRSALVENVKEGLATLGSTSIPPATPFWHYNVTAEEEYAFDLDRARRLLDDPKGDGTTLRIGETEPGNAGENLDPAAAINQDAFIDIDGDGIRDVVNETQVVAGDEHGPSKPNRDSRSTNGGGLAFDVSIINTDTEAQDAVQNHMVGWWSLVGIRAVPVIVSESRQLTVTYDCSASFYTWGWGGDVDPDFLLSIFITDQILYWQDAWYSDSQYDDLYILQQTQVDLYDRQATIHEMQRMVYHDAPYLIFWYDKILTVVRTDLFTGWGDWEAHPGLGLTGYGNDFLMLQLRAGAAPVNNCPTKPVIGGTPPITTFVGQDQAFVAEASDPDADALTWTWNWGDGSTSSNSTQGALGSVTVPTSHTWTATGTYFVNLAVDDGICPVQADPFEVFVTVRPAEAGWINGTVTDAGTGEPIPNAVVSTSPGGFQDTTDPNGKYSIASVPVGTYTVTASANLYASSSQANVAVTAGQTATVDFDLSPRRGWIVGTVTSSAGGALSGVAIRVVGERQYSGSTGADGTYNVTVLPGAYTVFATLTGYVGRNRTGVQANVDAETEVNFVLEPVPTPAPGLSPLAVAGVGLGVFVVVIALVAWAVVRRRRKAEQIEAPMPPPPKPPSAP